MEEIKIEENKEQDIIEIKCIYKLKGLHKSGKVYDETFNMEGTVGYDELCKDLGLKDTLYENVIDSLANVLISDIEEKIKRITEIMQDCIEGGNTTYKTVIFDKEIYVLRNFNSFEITYEIFIDGKKYK